MNQFTLVAMAAGVVLRVLLRCRCIHVDYLTVGRPEEARLDGPLTSISVQYRETLSLSSRMTG